MNEDPKKTVNDNKSKQHRCDRMTARILVTGSEGLIGTALTAALGATGHSLSCLDLRAPDAARGDVRDRESVVRAMADCDGVVHLAAVARVVVAERAPADCWETNVVALRSLLRAALDARRRPWVLFASSREVYGSCASLPATEDAPLSAVNVYGRSKVIGEALCGSAIEDGLRVAVVRLSNVYGSAYDHADRVIPAFVRAALAREPLRVDGADSTFDFTHLSDVVVGLRTVIDRLCDGAGALEPVHLTTGQATTLGELAARVNHLAGSDAGMIEAPRRTFDVSRFVGDPSRARALLGWRPRLSLDEGLARLICDFQRRTAKGGDA